MKVFNVILILLTTCLTWFTEAKVEDKIFLTAFFTVALMFWLMMMIEDDKKEDVVG